MSAHGSEQEHEMAFQVCIQTATAGDRTGEIYELVDDAESVRIEVWPQWGFNCLRWQFRQQDGRWADLLYTAPDWETNPVPTRSGQPILFPFPGRMRSGCLEFAGKTYQLPLNDSTRQHAIHGFTPRVPWRVVQWQGGEHEACITGQFDPSLDYPDVVGCWPGKYRLSITYRLSQSSLRVEALVQNHGDEPMPFGLGYHGYFRLPGVPEPTIDGHSLQASVDRLWVAEESLPTGELAELPPELDFRTPRPLASLQLDNGFTVAETAVNGAAGLVPVATLSHPQASGQLRVLADSQFRDLVLFIPAHRQAVAIEPYTCAADAANLAARGINSGWRVLPGGETWRGLVMYEWIPNEL